MDLDLVDILRELERQFPKELTICIQAVQLRKYQQQENNNEPTETLDTETC